MREKEGRGEREREGEGENTNERFPPKKQKRQLACRYGGASGFKVLLGSLKMCPP